MADTSIEPLIAELNDLLAGVGQLNPAAKAWLPAGFDELSHRIKEAQDSASHRGLKKKAALPAIARMPVPTIAESMCPTAMLGRVCPEAMLGSWADSLGNSVLVFSVDAYQVNLQATLSRPPRPDIHLKMQWNPSCGWVCGNAVLDPSWSTADQLHWVSANGKISVWVRPDAEDTPSSQKTEATTTEV
mmetsp:Transcript_90302/g.162835  ORF Transcript_90302/g.162835 Transcript_90302/m.162835 type:complete len:188 (+) Transcript_90302:66-629(+)